MSTRTSTLYNLLSAFLGGALWGGWAYIVNKGFGEKTRITSALVQGTASFIITLIMIRILTRIYHRIPLIKLRILIAPAITVTCTGSLLILIHYLAQTPEILATVSPPLTIAFLFCMFTAFKLHLRTHQNHR